MKSLRAASRASNPSDDRQASKPTAANWQRRMRKMLLYALPLMVALSILVFAVQGVLVTLRPVQPAGNLASSEQFPTDLAKMVAENCVVTFLNFDSQFPRSRYDEEVSQHCQPGDKDYGRQFGWDGQGSQTAVNTTSVVWPGEGPQRNILVELRINGPKQTCYQLSVYARDGQIAFPDLPRLAPCPQVSSLVRQPPFTPDPVLSALMQTDMETFFTAFAGNDCRNDRAHLAGLMANGLPIEGLGGSVRLDSVLNIAVEAREDALAVQEGDRRQAEVTLKWRDSDAAEAGLMQTYHLIMVKRGPHWLVEQLEESPAPIELKGC